MILNKLKTELSTPAKFYNAFVISPEGQASFEAAWKQFPNANNDKLDTNLFTDFIINHMNNWVCEHLSDDELDSAYNWLESYENLLRQIIVYSLL